MPSTARRAPSGATATPEVTLVNGLPRSVVGVPAHVNALDWLRGLGLTGAKEGCAEGECGACAVLVARPAADGRLLPPPDADDAERSPEAATEAATEWTAINSCLVPALSLAGQEVVTAEGLGTPADLHPVQQEMATRGGSQCGYCTPGFVCAMAAEFYRDDRTPDPDADLEAAAGEDADAEVGPNGFDLHALSGNLCRCTGYRPIRDAAYALPVPADDDPLAGRAALPAPAAPPLRTADYLRPASVAEALAVLAAEPEAVVVAGATDHGVEVNLRGSRPPLVVAVDRLEGLRRFVVTDHHVEIGAALTLTEVERRLAAPGAGVPLLAQALPQFASRLIRNGATIGGNLGTGSPIGDLAPALLALEAEVVLVGRGDDAPAERTVSLAGFFTGYRRSVRRPDELIAAVRVPLPLAPLTSFQKVAKRRFDDISGVAIAIALDVAEGPLPLVTRAVIGLGGVAATPLRARAAEAALVEQPWNAETAAAAGDVLAAEGTPIDDHRASAAYRRAMLAGALRRCFEEGSRPTPGAPQGVAR